MKKLLAIILTVLMVLGLAACGKEGGTSGGSSGGKNPTASSSKEKSQYSKAENFTINNNIFDSSKYNILSIVEGNGGADMPTLNGNTYIQRKNGVFGFWKNKSNGRIMFKDDIAEKIKSLGIDQNPTVIFRDKVSDK